MAYWFLTQYKRLAHTIYWYTDSNGFKNDRSAISNTTFVSHNITDLIKSGYVAQVPFQPFIVNPLSVVNQNCGKRIHWERTLSRCKSKLKSRIYFMFTFDLKSCYFFLHNNTLSSYFSWITALSFAISTGHYIFFKCFRPLGRIWQENDVYVVLYPNDGFGMNICKNSCYENVKCI